MQQLERSRLYLIITVNFLKTFLRCVLRQGLMSFHTDPLNISICSRNIETINQNLRCLIINAEKITTITTCFGKIIIYQFIEGNFVMKMNESHQKGVSARRFYTYMYMVGAHYRLWRINLYQCVGTFWYTIISQCLFNRSKGHGSDCTALSDRTAIFTMCIVV